AGDFNNDGKIDLFFAANQGDNKLFLNTGGLHFNDVTKAAQVPQDGGWSTGVSVVDINNDGLLDIYICRVGQLKGLPASYNQLLVCQGIGKDGIPTYAEKAHDYGLDFSGFSTQAVFFDYDNDGDLDLYLLNHTIHDNGTFGVRQTLLNTHNPLSGDRLYRNDNGRFTDVTAAAGINSSVIGYGLGVAVADINMDGYPDIYVGNDFHENDYMYINQKNGSFREELTSHTMHSSQFTMGVDIADVNNDGYPEIISMDMLPYDPYILKRSLGEDEYDIFNRKIEYGYNYQYTRNNLQYNRKNGMFSETGLYSGVAATDWSWAPLWMDFDNDGLKDLFISNGIPKRMNDIDYINYVSNTEVQSKIRDNRMGETDMALIDKFPEIKIPNKFFSNRGDLLFSDTGTGIAGDKPTFSNGAVYADFDNDGDLDIAVNNIDEPALLYENKSNDSSHRPSLEIDLKGPEKNLHAIGARVVLFANGGIRTYEKYPVHGFLSSMEIPLHIGLDKTTVDSMFVVWPDNTYEQVTLPAGSRLTLQYKKGLPAFDYSRITRHWKSDSRPMKDITHEVGLDYRHRENIFHEFDREPLLPHLLSTEGPALAIADINKDGLEDVYIGSSKWE
ncbi:MAG TPA: CRTAC1 family protein, partial [Chitinophagaceae bacterium]|nr:CRTAC1 family protein [Chitinophagaceae bacterium]